jgi:hypothetical protein
MEPDERVGADENRYASCVETGVRIGFAALLASFAIYLTGILPPAIEPSRLPQFWRLPVAEYVAQTGAPTGWSWVWRLAEGDLLNFAGVALLAGVTILAYLRVLPGFVRSGSRLQAALIVAQVAVLVVAATGLLSAVR